MGRSSIVSFSAFSKGYWRLDKIRDKAVIDTGVLEIQSEECDKMSEFYKQGRGPENEKRVKKRFCSFFIVRRTFHLTSAAFGPHPLTVVGMRGQKMDVTNVVIPDGIEVIGPAAFSDCENLEFLELPDSLRKICRMAFLRCRKLTSIVLPHGFETVEKCAFGGCSELKSVRFRPPAGCPNAVFIAWSVSVGRNRTNFGLTTLRYTRNVLRIITHFALNCRVLRSINEPQTLARSFAGCRQLISNFRNTHSINYVTAFLNARVVQQKAIDLSIQVPQSNSRSDVIDLT